VCLIRSEGGGNQPNGLADGALCFSKRVTRKTALDNPIIESEEHKTREGKERRRPIKPPNSGPLFTESAEATGSLE